MTDLVDHMAQLRAELRDGEFHLAHLQHLKREGAATQEQVNAVRADLDYLRREHLATSIRAQAIANGVALPEFEESDYTHDVRVRLRGLEEEP